MNVINEIMARLNGWEKCKSPSWFREFKLRQKIGFPNSFRLKGKTFKYIAFKKYREEQGSGLNIIYQFYRKKR